MGKVSLRYHLAMLRKADLRANDIATKTLDKRLDTLNDLRINVLTRDEYNTAHGALEDKLTALTDRFNTEVAGRRQGGVALWGYIIGAFGLLVGVATVVILVVHG